MIHIRLLGGMDLRGEDGHALDAALRQPKRLAVLIYLACARPRGFHRRDKLAALFWPELPDERARAALRTTLTRLRDDLGDDVLMSRGTDEIAVDGARVSCDVLDLERQIEGGDALEAAAAFAGPFLDGVHVDGVAEEFESWVAQERSRLVGALVGALRARGERARQRGEMDIARRALARAAELVPLDELVARELIGLHLAAGDHGSALGSFERLRDRLAREFGVAPSAETMAIVAPLQAADGPHAATAMARGRTARRLAATTVRDEPEGESAADSRSGADRWRGGVALGLAATVMVLIAWQVAWRTPEPQLPAWTSIRANDGTPLQLTSPAVALDSTEDALLIVHGAETYHPLRINPRVMRLRGVSGDVATWTTLEPQGATAPRPRFSASVAYDPSADRLFLFGGAFGTTSPCANDVWALEQASGLGGAPQWRPIATVGDVPGPRNAATMAFDAERRRLLVHGGNDCFTVHHTDTWILQFDDDSARDGRWHEVLADTSDGAPHRAPGGAVAFDADRGRLFVLAGFEGDARANALWVLDGLNELATRAPRWRRLGCAGSPPARLHAALVWDAARGEAMLFGGFDIARRYTNELWRLAGLTADAAGCQWALVPTTDEQPAARGGAVVRRRGRTGDLVLFGGFIGTSALGDLWRIAVAAPTLGR